MTKGSQ